MAVDWAAARRQFPALENWIYLNAATFGPVPRCAVEAVARHFADRDRTASLDFLDWYVRADGVRAAAARWIGAADDDIAFLPSAGVGLSWILEGLEWRPGDRLLTLEHEFPNNLYAGQMLDFRGVEAVEAPGDESFDPDELIGCIDERTRVVILSAVNYSSGLRPPLERIGRAARDAGALFVVDGTQGVGAIPFDVASTYADIVLVHGYKWMLSPTGSGFLYLRPETRERIRPIVVSWRSHHAWREVDSLHHGRPEPSPEAAAYEGGIQNFSGIFALGATLELFESLGREAIWDRVAANAEAVRRVLRKHGGEVVADRTPGFDSPIVTAAFPGADVSELAVRLRSKRVALAARKGRLRVSPHFYNNSDDFDALDEAFAETL